MQARPISPDTPPPQPPSAQSASTPAHNPALRLPIAVIARLSFDPSVACLRRSMAPRGGARNAAPGEGMRAGQGAWPLCSPIPPQPPVAGDRAADARGDNAKTVHSTWPHGPRRSKVRRRRARVCVPRSVRPRGEAASLLARRRSLVQQGPGPAATVRRGGRLSAAATAPRRTCRPSGRPGHSRPRTPRAGRPARTGDPRLGSPRPSRRLARRRSCRRR